MSSRVNRQLASVVHALDLRISNELAQRLKPYQLTTEQSAVLSALWQRDGIKQRELAQLLDKDAPNMTRMLEKMEKHGWVQRRPDAADKRVTLVFNAQKSLDQRETLQALLEDFRRELYRGISAAEQSLLFALLNRTLSNLKKLSDKRP